MADIIENTLPSQESVALTDYVRVVGENGVSYKQLVSDIAKTIVESYSGTSLLGQSQSIQEAINKIYPVGSIYMSTQIREHYSAVHGQGFRADSYSLPEHRNPQHTQPEQLAERKT